MTGCPFKKDHQMTMLSSERKAGEFHDGLRFAGA